MVGSSGEAARRPPPCFVVGPSFTDRRRAERLVEGLGDRRLRAFRVKHHGFAVAVDDERDRRRQLVCRGLARRARVVRPVRIDGPALPSCRGAVLVVLLSAAAVAAVAEAALAGRGASRSSRPPLALRLVVQLVERGPVDELDVRQPVERRARAPSGSPPRARSSSRPTRSSSVFSRNVITASPAPASQRGEVLRGAREPPAELLERVAGRVVVRVVDADLRPQDAFVDQVERAACPAAGELERVVIRGAFMPPSPAAASRAPRARTRRTPPRRGPAVSRAS